MPKCHEYGTLIIAYAIRSIVYIYIVLFEKYGPPPYHDNWSRTGRGPRIFQYSSRDSVLCTLYNDRQVIRLNWCLHITGNCHNVQGLTMRMIDFQLNRMLKLSVQ
jgi:hypothetical protein